MDLDEEIMLIRCKGSVWQCPKCKFFHYTPTQHSKGQRHLLSLSNVKARCMLNSSPRKPLELAQMLTERADKVVNFRSVNVDPGLMRSFIHNRKTKSRMDDEASIINYIKATRKASGSPYYGKISRKDRPSRLPKLDISGLQPMLSDLQ